MRWLKRIIGSDTGDNAEIGTPTRRTASLSPTPDGADMGASGRAEINEDGEWQRFLVQVRANVPDGTVLTLLVDGRPAGPIEMSDSEGTFEVATSEGLGLPNGVRDLGEIRRLEVADKQGVSILTGTFAHNARAVDRRRESRGAAGSP
jgi:hypothetical protein